MEHIEDCHRRIGDHETRIALLEQSREEHTKMLYDLERMQDAILERLGQSATHGDILTLSEKIDTSINTLLRDALNSVPHRVIMVWSMIAGIVAIVGLFIMFWQK